MPAAAAVWPAPAHTTAAMPAAPRPPTAATAAAAPGGVEGSQSRPGGSDVYRLACHELQVAPDETLLAALEEEGGWAGCDDGGVEEEEEEEGGRAGARVVTMRGLVCGAVPWLIVLTGRGGCVIITILDTTGAYADTHQPPPPSPPNRRTSPTSAPWP